MHFHYKGRENETIQCVDVISLYPYTCRYFKFPVGHPNIRVRDACKDKEVCIQMEGLMKCHRGGCIVISSPTQATINYCFVYEGHAFSNGTYPENVGN